MDSLFYFIVENFDDLVFIFFCEDGKIYVINFWVIWCGFCVEELFYFECLVEEIVGQEVEIILVSFDFK